VALILPDHGPGVGPAHGGVQQELLIVWEWEIHSFPISKTAKKFKIDDSAPKLAFSKWAINEAHFDCQGHGQCEGLQGLQG
jgi:hypothetical protein